MRSSKLNFDQSERTLRQFSAAWLFVFGCLAVGPSFDPGRSYGAIACLLLAISVGLVGLLRPWLVRPIYLVAAVLTFPVGWCMSQLLLAVIFLGCFVPIGVLLRVMRNDMLGRHRRTDSYWQDRGPTSQAERYLRQF